MAYRIGTGASTDTSFSQAGETIANAVCAFVRLVERGKEDIAYPERPQRPAADHQCMAPSNSTVGSQVSRCTGSRSGVSYLPVYGPSFGGYAPWMR